MVAMLFYVDTPPDTGAVAVVDGDEYFTPPPCGGSVPASSWCLVTVRRLGSAVAEQADVAGCGPGYARRWSVSPVLPATVVQALPKLNAPNWHRAGHRSRSRRVPPGMAGGAAWRTGTGRVSTGGFCVGGERKVRSAARQPRWAHPAGRRLSTPRFSQRLRRGAGAAVLVLHEEATERIVDRRGKLVR